jgi:hypothetical protein
MSVSDYGISAPSGAAPTFVPRKGFLMREYCVLARWPNGRREKIGSFPRKVDAVRWIRQKSGEGALEQANISN